MQRKLTLTSVIAAVGMSISACSSDYGPTGYGNSYGAPMASTPANDGARTLTVMNFFGWCSVTINGGAASTGETLTVSVTPGSMVTIVAAPVSGFEIGTDPWFGVDENNGGAARGTDVGSGSSAMSTASVTIAQAGATQCVSVCCQEPGNAPTPCPTMNPCP
jgi:hypothetical protein